ncbi:MAG: alpha/beta hydrolase [Cephaloticoccus sp.]|nr:alpha/beta hydrolase [Cephaloticoccus sp.]
MIILINKMRFGIIIGLILGLSSVAFAQEKTAPRTIVIVHGAWGGAWQFAKIDPLLRNDGFDVRRVTLTGLGERSHLANRDIGLETHIEDVSNIIRFEDLHDIILIGHSYGGMVITGVADRMPGRIAQLIYLEAMVPRDGESAMSLMSANGPAMQERSVDGFIAPWWVRPGKPHPIDVPHPVKTLTDPIVLKNPSLQSIPSTFILTVEPGKDPQEDEFYAASIRAQQSGWKVITMAGDHNPHWRQPQATVEVLERAIAGARK